MNVTIRRATAKDVPTISEIYALSWKVAYRGMIPQQYLDDLKLDFWNHKFYDWITNSELRADLLYVDDVPAGCVAYGKARDEQLSNWGEIVSIYFRPEYFRKGYGHKLIATAIENLRADGYKDCYLWVLSENKNAQHFYEQNDFVCDHNHCHSEIMGKQLTELRYIRHLD